MANKELSHIFTTELPNQDQETVGGFCKWSDFICGSVSITKWIVWMFFKISVIFRGLCNFSLTLQWQGLASCGAMVFTSSLQVQAHRFHLLCLLAECLCFTTHKKILPYKSSRHCRDRPTTHSWLHLSFRSSSNQTNVSCLHRLAWSTSCPHLRSHAWSSFVVTYVAICIKVNLFVEWWYFLLFC